MNESLKKEFKKLIKDLKKQSLLNSKRQNQNKIMNDKIKKLKILQNTLYYKLNDLSTLVNN